MKNKLFNLIMKVSNWKHTPEVISDWLWDLRYLKFFDDVDYWKEDSL